MGDAVRASPVKSVPFGVEDDRVTPAPPLELLGGLWAFPVREVLVLVVGAAAALLVVRRLRRGPDAAAWAGAAGHGLLLGTGAAQVLWLLHLRALTALGPLTAGEVVLCATALLVVSVVTSTAALLAVAARRRSVAGASLVGALAGGALVAGSTGLLDTGAASRPWALAALAALALAVVLARRGERRGRADAERGRDRL